MFVILNSYQAPQASKKEQRGIFHIYVIC